MRSTDLEVLMINSTDVTYNAYVFDFRILLAIVEQFMGAALSLASQQRVCVLLQDIYVQMC